MFDFIFKRRTKNAEAVPVNVVVPAVTTAQANQEKRAAALQKLESIKQDETAVLNFLLA